MAPAMPVAIFRQVSFFAPLQHVAPTSALYTSLLRRLPENFLPGSFTIIDPLSNTRSERVRMRNVGTGIVADIETERFSIEQLGVDSDFSNMHSESLFLSAACDLIEGLASEVGKNSGHRLAYVQRVRLDAPENSAPITAEDIFAESISSLFSDSPDHSEWSARVNLQGAFSFGKFKDEKVNRIVSISSKLQVQFGDPNALEVVFQDSVLVSFDTNTLQTNLDQRFGTDDVRPFLSKASKQQDEMLRKISLKAANEHRDE